MLNVIIGPAISFKNTSETLRTVINVQSPKYLIGVLIVTETKTKCFDHPILK